MYVSSDIIFEMNVIVCEYFIKIHIYAIIMKFIIIAQTNSDYGTYSLYWDLINILNDYEW